MHKNYIFRSMLFIVAFAAGMKSYGQETFWCDTVGSDYFITTHWTSVPDISYSCSKDHDWIHAGSDFSNQDYFGLEMGHVAHPDGSHRDTVGPSISRIYSIRERQDGQNVSGTCLTSTSSVWLRDFVVPGRTDSLHPVASASSTILNNGAGLHLVKLTWTKGSDIPDGPRLQYRIYRDSAGLIGTILSTGGANAFIDSTAILGAGTYTYHISSYVADATWGTHESVKVTVTATITNSPLQATDASMYGKSQLVWPSMAPFAPEGINIFRDSVQIDVVNNNITHYNDFDGVPGRKYLYSIGPILSNHSVPYIFSDSGSSRPNGVLSGYVKSVVGAGIVDDTITVTAKIGGVTFSYTNTTDAQGFYRIRDIYYDTLATYTVVSKKNQDKFNPDTIRTTLDLINSSNTLADIIDTTVFTVSGRVTMQGGACAVRNAQLFVDGSNSTISTNTTGGYSFTVQHPGATTIHFSLFDHTFDYASRTINVQANTPNINFLDTKTDTLIIDLKDGCHHQVVDSAYFQVTSTDGSGICFDQTYPFYGQQVIHIPLSSQKYTVKLIDAWDDLGHDIQMPLSMNTIDVDLTKDTAIVGADTLHLVHRADFVYHGPIHVVADGIDSGCVGYTADQGNRIRVFIKVQEAATYHGQPNCDLDTATVRVNDLVSGVGVQYLHIDSGRLIYNMIPDEPNTTGGGQHPYQKLFDVSASTAGSSDDLPIWVTIVGDKGISATFVSKAPPMALMVLHDPPGSNSYATFEKDSSYSSNLSNYAGENNNAGFYVGIQAGPAIPTSPVPTPYFKTSIDYLHGVSRDSSYVRNFNFTATQTISTSSDPQFVGRDADVFIGGTMNTKYANVKQLRIVNCVVQTHDEVVWGLDSITSHFAYTGLHIKNTLIPQLDSLWSQETDPTQKKYFDDQRKNWQTLLDRDSIAILSSNYPNNNISFSAGIGYDYTAQLDTSYSHDDVYTASDDVDFMVGVGISDGGVIDAGVGIHYQYHSESGYDNTSNATQSSIFSYHLEDATPGNFFSVSIGSDKFYGSPIFKLFGGTSACPHEEGTRFRDVPTIVIANSALYNVSPTVPASFIAQLGNESESSETRTYNVQVDPNTNLDGATIKIGGQNITQFPASFTIPTGTPINAAISVEKGPFADYYDDLGIIISSPCDPDISVTQFITVHFQSTCSDIAIGEPANNWLANSSNHDSLRIAFTGYDAHNANLQEIGLQYRISGSAQLWHNANSIPASALTGPYSYINLNLAPLTDGTYELRAYAKCLSPTSGLSYTYSPVVSGVIDRRGVDLFGTPEPANGILNRGDNISITFNSPIDCNHIYGGISTSLRRADNGISIPDSVICSGNGLILKIKSDSLLNTLDGIVLTASVYDLHDANGNALGQPIQWSFMVNRALVYWTPSNMNITNTVGTPASGIGTLINTATTKQGYALTSYPSWLAPSKLTDSITPGGLDSIRFTVTLGLNPGTYMDTVIAAVGGLQARLYVKLDVVKPAPNWSVNPADYQYSMSITANYSLTQLNAPLSTDKRDMIAVFKDDTCRGVAHISYDPFTSRYVAFIAAYSNTTTGDNFTFRMWDAVPGTEYQAVEQLAFVNDGIIGQPVQPKILHPAGVFQTIALTTGWNWFSLNVVAPDMGPNNVLAHLHPDDGQTVKGLNSMCQYNASNRSWSGNLNNFGTSASYMMLLSHPDTIHVLGQPVTSASSMSIAIGWNWIGYPYQNIIDVPTYMATANSANGDLLKTQSQFTQYNSGAWSGSLNNLSPGLGYRLFAANAYNFVIPAERSLPSWIVDQNQFQQNQSVTAELRFDDIPILQSHYLVGAFANNTCIGIGQPIFIPGLNIYRVFMVAHGDLANAGQPISFKVYDTDNDLEYTPTYDPISVAPDTTIARIAAPYVINVQTATGLNTIAITDGYSLQQNVPNPFARNTSIQYAIPAAQHVTLTLYDEAGRQVAELVNADQDAGKHSVSFVQENLQSGVYFYQMKSGDFTKTRRMLILK